MNIRKSLALKSHTQRTGEWSMLRLTVGAVVAVNVRALVLLDTHTAGEDVQNSLLTTIN